MSDVVATPTTLPAPKPKQAPKFAVGDRVTSKHMGAGIIALPHNLKGDTTKCLVLWKRTGKVLEGPVSSVTLDTRSFVVVDGGRYAEGDWTLRHG